MSKTINENNLKVEYVPEFYAGSLADDYFQQLMDTVNFEPITFTFAGRDFTPARKVCAYGTEGLSYGFSKTAVTAKPWTPIMQTIKADVEQHMGVGYNFCLLNYYPDGNAKISAHHDKESSLDAEVPIACVSFGATRKMEFTRGKDFPSPTVDLEHGSLLSMHAPTNHYWKHGIPAQPEITAGRISLTFRALSTETPKRKLTTENPPPKRPRCLQDDPANELLLEKEIGMGALLKVYHTRYGLYVGLYPINTGTPYDYSCAVFMNPTIWLEFSTKLRKFNLFRKESSFVCSDQVMVCAKHDTTCVIQAFSSAAFGCRLKHFGLELNSDELNKLQIMVPQISEFILNNLFSVSLPKLIRQCAVSHNGIIQLASVNENIFWESITQAMSDMIHKYFKCDACDIDDPSQWNHECMMLSTHEKFNFMSQDVLMAVNISKLSKTICENVNINQLDKDVLISLTLEKCLQAYKKCSKI